MGDTPPRFRRLPPLSGLPESIEIARIAKIPLYLTLRSAVVIVVVAALVTGYGLLELALGGGFGPLTSALALLALLSTMSGAVLVHELGHFVVAKRQGLTIREITFGLLNGSMSFVPEDDPRTMFRLAIGGPLASLLTLAVGVSLCVLLTGGRDPFAFGIAPTIDPGHLRFHLGLDALGLVTAPVVVGLTVHAVVAAMNLLPRGLSDGGIVMLTMLWRRTGDLPQAVQLMTRRLAQIGWTATGAAVVVALGGAVLLVREPHADPVTGVDVLHAVLALPVIVLLGFAVELSFASRHNEKVLSPFARVIAITRIRVRDVVEEGPVTVSLAASLEEAHWRVLAVDPDHDRVPVVDDAGHLVGTLGVASLKRALAEAAPAPCSAVAELVETVDDDEIISIDAPLWSLISDEDEDEARLQAAMVVDGDGILRGRLDVERIKALLSAEQSPVASPA